MTRTTDPAPGAEQVAPTSSAMPRRDLRRALIGLMTGMFAAVLAATVVSNALPVILSDLGGSQSVYTWVVTAELLAMTATVPLWGRLADSHDKKVLIQLALTCFLLGSIASGLAQDTGTLIAARVLQGIGAGGVTALVQVVMAVLLPPRELGRYAGAFGAVFAGATVSGPLIGGVLVDTSWLGWRAIFFLSAPLALLAIALLQFTQLPPGRRPVRVDWPGALLITAGLCQLLIWVTLAGHRFAWLSTTSAVMVFVALLLLGLAGWAETRAPDPIVPLALLTRRTLALTAAASALIGVAMYGGTVFLAEYFQVARGYTPTESGLLNLPMVLGLLVSSTVAGALISRSGRWKHHLLAGAGLMASGFTLLSSIDIDTSIGSICAFLVVLGVGLGLLVQNLVLVAQNDVPPSQLGAATAVLTFARTLGGTVGVSVLGAVLASRVATDLGDQLPASHGDAVPDLSTLPPELLRPVQDVYADATAHLFSIATPLAVVALVAVLLLEEIPLKRTSAAQRAAQEQEASATVA